VAYEVGDADRVAASACCLSTWFLLFRAAIRNANSSTGFLRDVRHPAIWSLRRLTGKAQVRLAG